MAKIHPSSLRLPAVTPPETRTFEDPALPGQVFTITLRAPNGTWDAEAAGAEVERLKPELVTGGWYDEGRKMHMPEPRPLPPVFDENGQPLAIVINERTLWRLAYIVHLQGGPEEDRYTIEELIPFAFAMQKTFAEIDEWVGAMDARAKKNPSTSGGESKEQSDSDKLILASALASLTG